MPITIFAKTGRLNINQNLTFQNIGLSTLAEKKI